MSIVEQAGIPPLLRQRNVGGAAWIGRVDFLDPDRRLVVEIDSDIHHTSLADRASDARRDAAMRAAGYTVLRIGEEAVRRRPEEVVQLLKAS